jgi:hypothetical protein
MTPVTHEARKSANARDSSPGRGAASALLLLLLPPAASLLLLAPMPLLLLGAGVGLLPLEFVLELADRAAAPDGILRSLGSMCESCL